LHRLESEVDHLGGHRAVKLGLARGLDVFQPVVEGGAGFDVLIEPAVAGANRAAGRDLAGDQAVVQLDPRAGLGRGAVEVEAQVVDLVGRLPGDLDGVALGLGPKASQVDGGGYNALEGIVSGNVGESGT
jgi:hypothetical protein